MLDRFEQAFKFAESDHTLAEVESAAARMQEEVLMRFVDMRAQLQHSVPTSMDIEPTNMPSFDEISSRFVPVLRNVPKELRTDWARCLTRTVAHTVFHNSEEAWKELLMLPMCVLCSRHNGVGWSQTAGQQQ